MAAKVIVFRDGLEERADSPPLVLTTREGHRVESYRVDGLERFFVTLAESHYCAHGNTLAEAVADAIWKDEKKRPSLEAVKQSIRNDGASRKITLQEFRVLTGACRAGCMAALRQAGLNGSPMIAKDIKKHFPEWGAKLLAILEWE
jgi:hypothetical protein